MTDMVTFASRDCGSDADCSWCSCGGLSGCGVGLWVDGICEGCGSEGKVSDSGYGEWFCRGCDDDWL